MPARVLVLGGSFAGMTAALSVRARLGSEAEVTVVADRDLFVFNPSLIWLPFGKRTRDDIAFPLAPTFARHGVRFVQAIGRGEAEAGPPTAHEQDEGVAGEAASGRAALEAVLADLRACRALLAGLEAADPEGEDAA